jgi:hypothetical protein
MLFALLALATEWSTYRSQVLVAAAWVVTAGVLPAGAWLTRVSGQMTGVVLLCLAGTLYIVDVVVPLSVAPPLRIGSSTWNWGAAAIVFLGLAAYRPPRQVIALAGVHTLIGLGFALFGSGDGPVDGLATVLLISGCLLPTVVAAQFVGLYAHVLRIRQTALDIHRAMLRDQAAEEGAAELIMGRISRLRFGILHLLDRVAGGAELPLDADSRIEAQQLASALRRELDQSRTRGWFWWRPVNEAATGNEAPELHLSGAPDLLTDQTKAGLGAILNQLAVYPGWRRIGLSVTPEPAAPKSRNQVDITLVAEGDAAPVAAGDPNVLGAASYIGATVWQGDEDALVIEATADHPQGGPHLWQPVAVSERKERNDSHGRARGRGQGAEHRIHRHWTTTACPGRSG